MSRPEVLVVGGGLAGITAALDCADAGAHVTLLERRHRLGGLTWSFEHEGHWVDNGQHVFLRCCTAYRGFLGRVGSAGDVDLGDRLDVTVLRPGPAGQAPLAGRLRSDSLPAPFHLGRSLLGLPLLGWADRLRLGRAVLPLRRADLGDPALDRETFGDWLARHGQRPAAIEAVWDLITVATVNLPAAQASAAMGAKVFQTGLLTDRRAADIGWSRVPLGRLHGEHAAAALAEAGVEVLLGVRADTVRPSADGRWEALAGGHAWVGDAAVVALPHQEAASTLPASVLPAGGERLSSSPIVNVHVVFDRRVTGLTFAATVGSPLQWVFDRTEASGLPEGQYLAASVSAATEQQGRHPDDLGRMAAEELVRLFPAASSARVVDTLVTKERHATFAAVPGTAALRPPARTSLPGLALAGAWTDTGWPATMEGAVRSGHAASRVALLALAGARGASSLAVPADVPPVPDRLPEEVA